MSYLSLLILIECLSSGIHIPSAYQLFSASSPSFIKYPSCTYTYPYTTSYHLFASLQPLFTSSPYESFSHIVFKNSNSYFFSSKFSPLPIIFLCSYICFIPIFYFHFLPLNKIISTQFSFVILPLETSHLTSCPAAAPSPLLTVLLSSSCYGNLTYFILQLIIFFLSGTVILSHS